MDITKHLQYKLEEQEDLKDIDSKGYVLRHVKSGARVVLIENEDNNKTFSIGFRTPPDDDTGVAHITEHSVLCGSEKFPVKDPFMELVKGSLNTFLNAMTYPDKTVYPVASTNNQDFKNLMNIYMDGVLHPNIYTRPEIFKQEGITLSLEDKDSELKYNGVVYNEMKGAFSSADDVLDRVITASLYPDTCYSVESGGNPDFIPDLTYEKFLDFHRRYYHPSNSYIYVYGDIDMDWVLDWMDKEYLSAYDLLEIQSEIELQKPFEKMADVREEYPVSDTEDIEENTYLSYNFVVGDILDRELNLAMQILEYAIVSMPGSPVKKALLDAGIGKDVSGRFNNFIRQPYFTFTAKSADEAKKDEFVKTIRKTFEELVRDGIDKDALLAALNNYEFQYRENDFGSYPKGLMYSFTVFDSWLYDDSKPFRHLIQNDLFDSLREKMKTDYFEKLIEKYFLNNTHCSVVSIVPVRGLQTVNDEKLREKLQKIKDSMTEEEIRQLVEETRHLKEYQETESTKEELDTIPVLNREDLSTKVEPFYNKEVKVKDVTVLRHDLFTNGIAYFDFMFDVTDLPNEFLPYLGIFKGVMGYMDTEHYSYSEISNMIGIHTGGIYTEANVIANPRDSQKYSIKFEIKGKVFADKIGKAMELIREMIYHGTYDDEKRLYEILCEGKSNLQRYLMNASDSMAVLRNRSYMFRSSLANDWLKGISYYKTIEAIVADFENRKGEVMENLKKIAAYIFRGNNALLSYTADDEGYAYFEPCVGEFAEELNKNNHAEIDLSKYPNREPEVKNEGMKTSSQVSYVTRAGDFKQAGLEYDASLRVLKTILSSEYLWKNIREQGGAYGCNCGFMKNGGGYFTSYRDPNVGRTNDVFEKAAEYVENFDTDERSMTKFVIGTISSMDTPLTVLAKGNRSTAAYLSGETIEQLQKERMEVLTADVEKIRSLAPYVRAVLASKNICVIGNENKIEEEKELFETTFHLFE